MDETLGVAEVPGASLHYRRVGRGQSVVLVHGFTLDGRMWTDVADNLADEYDVLTYDVRGHGRSSMPTAEPYAHRDDLSGLKRRPTTCSISE